MFKNYVLLDYNYEYSYQYTTIVIKPDMRTYS